jgi:CDP-paratose 2-epimerase
VRDNIHSYDVARFIHCFIESPRAGEVYNLGGGKDNSCSILEAFQLVAGYTGRAQRYVYTDTARVGDHICYYSDLRRMKEHYRTWGITKTLDDTVAEIVASWRERLQPKAV